MWSVVCLLMYSSVALFDPITLPGGVCDRPSVHQVDPRDVALLCVYMYVLSAIVS